LRWGPCLQGKRAAGEIGGGLIEVRENLLVNTGIANVGQIERGGRAELVLNTQ
jgi:hypothetical protein